MMNKFADAKSRGVRVKARLTALLVFAAILVALFAQGALAGGYALSGVGSKAINMGGAFRGLADDWSAAYWNPAGLTQTDSSEINGMLVAISPRPEYKPNILFNGLNVGYRNGQTLYPNDKTSFIPDVSGFFKLRNVKGMTVGLAIYVPYGLGSEWDLFNATGLDLSNPFPVYDHKADLNIIDFHPTVAKAFLDGKFSVGVGFSAQRGDITFSRTYLKSDGLPLPHNNLVIFSEMKGNGWGYGANFGVLYKISPKLQVGVSGRTGSTIKLKGSAKQELYTFNNETLKDILLGEATTAADSAQIRFLFSANNHLSSPSAKADLKTPFDIGLGLAFKPSEKLTVTGDIAYTKWSALDSILIRLSGVAPDGSPAQNSAIVLNWKNTVRFSAGVEYRVSEPLAIRLGYYYDPSPIPIETLTPLIPDLGNKNSFNIGAGYRYAGAELSYNFEYLTFQSRTVSVLSDLNHDLIYDNFPGAYKSKLYASHISLSYRF
jgi:long-chain fatty acid transport protein